MYDIVLVLLMNFLENKNQDVNIDNCTNILIKKLNEYLIEFEIIEMKFIRNDFSNQNIVARNLNCREMMFFNLISFELLNFVVDLTTHFFMIQLQNSRSLNTSTKFMNYFLSRTHIITNDHRFESRTINSINNHLSILIVRRYKLTYSSTFLNCINISDCSIFI